MMSIAQAQAVTSRGCLLVSYSTLARPQHVCRGTAAKTQRDTNLQLPSRRSERAAAALRPRPPPDALT